MRVEFTLDAGPRIVRFSRPGAPNVFAETPSLGWETSHGRPYRLLGGHRLWSSPECALEEQLPDDVPVAVSVTADGVELRGGSRTSDGLARTLVLEFDDGAPSLRVNHVLTNETDASVEVAVWALTQLAPGGTAVLPQQQGAVDGDQLPNRHFVLWPYSSLADRRLRLADDAVRVDATAVDGLFKIGYLNRAGWVAYELGDTVFRKVFTPEPSEAHVDQGCNVEVYVRAEFLELETLSPLRSVAPGASVEHLEVWELSAGANGSGP